MVPFLWPAATPIMNLYIKIPFPLEPSVNGSCSHGATEPYSMKTDSMDWIVHPKGTGVGPGPCQKVAPIANPIKPTVITAES